MENKSINNLIFSKEREFYHSEGLVVNNCVFEGKEDGESPFKESKNLEISNTVFGLRYPLWHCSNVHLYQTNFKPTSRAPLWYSNDVRLDNVTIKCPKILRETTFINVNFSDFDSDEVFWKCNRIFVYHSKIVSEYAFFMSKDVHLETVDFKGKYALQYCEGGDIANCVMNTKDAFWHSKNMVIRNSDIIGEYIGWYSENLTFINCKFKGTQPFCYCKALKLVNCEFDEADLAFEYSEIEASLAKPIISIKNPYKGKIIVPGVKEVIITEDSKYPCECDIKIAKE